MQMYVNYYDRYEKIEGENPTIGILLCKQSDEALVDLTLPENANIFAKSNDYLKKSPVYGHFRKTAA